jgi:hypothetical protein
MLKLNTIYFCVYNSHPMAMIISMIVRQNDQMPDNNDGSKSEINKIFIQFMRINKKCHLMDTFRMEFGSPRIVKIKK